MRYLLLLVVLILAESALADCPPKKEECPPKPKVVTVYKTQIQKQEVPKVETQAETKALSEAVADAEAQATTGNQTITINMPQPVKVLKRTITKKVTKIKKVKVLVYKPNRLQLFLGLTKTKLEIEQTCCMYSTLSITVTVVNTHDKI